MNRATLKRWIVRVLIALVVLIALILFVVLPVGASFLITNSRFRFPERGPKTPDSVGLSVDDAEFESSDGIPLGGWWNPGDASMPVIIFVHGLNRSRVELLERHRVAVVFQQPANRCSREPFAQGRYDTAGHEDVLH